MLQIIKIEEQKNRKFSLTLENKNPDNNSCATTTHNLSFEIFWDNEGKEWAIRGNNNATYSAAELSAMLDIVNKLNKRGGKGDLDVD